MIGMVPGLKDACWRNDSGKNLDGGQNRWFSLHFIHEEILRPEEVALYELELNLRLPMQGRRVA